MGPVIRVPEDLAQKLLDDTDLVVIDEALSDAVDEFDLQLGGATGDILLLTETPEDGYGRLVSLITDYATCVSLPFELIVSDKDGNPHAFSASAVNGQSIREHLKLTYFGALGDRRPLIPE